MNSILTENSITRANLIPKAARGISLFVLVLSIAMPAGSQTFSGKIFAYSSSKLSAATGVINHADSSFTTLRGPIEGFSPWTHVVGAGSEILFYDSNTGHAAIGQVSAAGDFKTIQSIKNGSLGPGWSHITFHKGYYLFYSKDSGLGVIGNFAADGFHEYGRQASLSKGWTTITSTENALLFYNKDSGSGSAGQWEFVKSGPGFGTITQVTYKQLKPYGPGSFKTGWTNIVNTSDGVLFYCSPNGKQSMTNVEADGSVTTRSEGTIATGWDLILSQGGDILFYKPSSGDVAIGGIHELSVSRGLEIRKTHLAYFSPGWTNIVATND